MTVLIFLLLYICCAGTITVFALAEAWLAWKTLRTSQVFPKLRPPMVTGALPKVLIQLPIYNESSVIERLLQTISKIDYPATLLTVQLLDDSTDETTQIAAHAISQLLKNQNFSISHVRRSSRLGFKAGALQHGLEIDKGQSEFIAIFDADFIPEADFLRRTIPYFSDRSVGMVQTKWQHVNEAESIVTKIMALAIDNHFVVQHGGRQAANGFINFNGTAGVWRRAAIDAAGGWADDSLTEDLDLSFRCQIAGWKCLYVRDIETPSELPATLSGLRTQQFRWTKGSTEAALKLSGPVLRSNVSPRTKLLAILQLFSGIQFPFALVFGIAALGYHFQTSDHGLRFMQLSAALMLTSTLAISFSYIISQRTLGRGSIRDVWRIFWRTQLFSIFAVGFGFMNTWANLEALIGYKTEFVRTPKSGATGNNSFIPQGSVGNKRFSKFIVFEIALTLLFAFAAVHAFIQWRATVFPLLPIFMFYAAGLGTIVFLSWREVKTSNKKQKFMAHGDTAFMRTLKIISLSRK